MEDSNSKYEITQIAYLDMKKKFIMQKHQIDLSNDRAEANS